MRRALVLLFLVACKHTTTTDGASVAPEQVDNDAGCDSPCCTRPQEGAPCSFDGGTSNENNCTWSNHCPTGLVTSQKTECTNGGTWIVTAGKCPAEGDVDERYCPASQPVPDTPCNPQPSGPCGYVLVCEGGISATAQATCLNGKWQTTPLKC